MVERKIKYYDEVRFDLVENLTGGALEEAKKKNIEKGPVIVRFSSNSIPVWSVEKLEGSPTARIRQRAIEEGVDLEGALKRAFPEDRE